MVTHPAGEPQSECALCGRSFESYDPEFAASYVNLVCERCDAKAVNRDGDPPAEDGAVGENPVFIDGHTCWRLYREDGHVTRLDEFDCDSEDEFRERHR